jgi:HEAT repeat protein
MQMANESTIDILIRQLSSQDGQVREKARLALVHIGKEATLPLTILLSDKDQQTRWEAAKALVAIADPVAIPALVNALEDKVFEVRWLASEALVGIGIDSIKPLLETLREHSDNLFVREEAHHVFKYIQRDNPKANELSAILKPVIDELEGSTPGVSTPGAAQRALEKLKVIG